MKNKQTIYTLLLILIFTSIKAQVVFPNKNATWIFESGKGEIFAPAIKVSVLGDTLLIGKKFSKLYQSFPHRNPAKSSYKGAFRVDSLARKVYAFNPTTSSEYLLYDFSLGVGDSLPYTDVTKYKPVIIAVDSVFCYGKQRKIQSYKMHVASANTIGYVIDGIGLYYYNGTFLSPLYGGHFEPDQDYFLGCFNETIADTSNGNTLNGNNWYCNKSSPLAIDRSTIYEQKQYLVFPNPSEGVIILSPTSFQNQTIKIYDMYGRIVYEKQNSELLETEIDLTKSSKGVYSLFVGGLLKEKFVLK